MAEKVGALAYDLVMNTVRFEKGMRKTRSSLKTLNQNFRKAAKPVEEYEQRIRDIDLAFSDGQITAEQRKLFSDQEVDSLKKAGFILDKNGKAQKTEAKILEEKIESQRELNNVKRLEKKLADETNRFSEQNFKKRRFRNEEEHRRVLQRAHEINKINKSRAKQHLMDIQHSFAKSRSFLGGMSAGQQAGVFGNVAGAMGASGATIGAVRGAAMLGKEMIPLVGTVGALGLGLVKAAKNAAELRKTTIDLSVLMNNSDEAAAGLIKRFQKLARETPLTTAQLAEGARQLMSFGRQSRYVEDDLRNLGTIAGGDAERLRLLVKAFGDVTAAGKLQGQELRQFTNQGFNPLRIMADMTGESYDSLRKKMEQGAFSSQMVADTIAVSAHKMSDRLVKAMDTIGGQFSKLKGILFEMSTGPGQPVERAGAIALDYANAFFEGVDHSLKQLSKFGQDEAYRISNQLGRIKDFLSFDFANSFKGGFRFGKPLRLDEIEDLREEKRLRILKAQDEAAKIEGRTINANRKLMDDVSDQIQEQKEMISDLTFQLKKVDKFQQMRIQAFAHRKALQFTEQDYERHIEQINELQKLEQEAEKKRRILEEPLEDAQKMHDFNMQRISDEEQARMKEVENRYRKEIELANAMSGGPSDDFSVGGADYRFVQQRNSEIRSNKITEAANKRREEQLDQIKEEIAEQRRQQKLDLIKVLEQLRPI